MRAGGGGVKAFGTVVFFSAFFIDSVLTHNAKSFFEDTDDSFNVCNSISGNIYRGHVHSYSLSFLFIMTTMKDTLK